MRPGGEDIMTTPDSLYLLKDGQQTGPHAVEVLRQRLDSGEVSPADLVWGEGMAEWVAVASVLGHEAPGGDEGEASGMGPEADALPDERGFGSMLVDALAYPFRGDGFLILVLGTVLFTGLDFVGRFSWIISAAAWGYMLLMLQQVLHGTAMGEDRVPNWPDIDGFGELLGKTFQWVGVLAACFGPGIFVLMTATDEDVGRLATGVGLLLIGLVIGPMALLSVGMHDTLNGLHPGLIFRSMARAPGHYVAVLLVILLLAFVQFLAGKLSDLIPIAGVVIDQLDALWSAVFLARVLGAFYYVNRRRLSWFGE
jgi:hypothetical protein